LISEGVVKEQGSTYEELMARKGVLAIGGSGLGNSVLLSFFFGFSFFLSFTHLFSFPFHLRLHYGAFIIYAYYI